MIQKLKEYIVSNIFSALEIDSTKVQYAAEKYIKALES